MGEGLGRVLIVIVNLQGILNTIKKVSNIMDKKESWEA
jgi:hypothetical protein